MEALLHAMDFPWSLELDVDINKKNQTEYLPLSRGLQPASQAHK